MKQASIQSALEKLASSQATSSTPSTSSRRALHGIVSRIASGRLLSLGWALKQVVLAGFYEWSYGSCLMFWDSKIKLLMMNS
jgi:hypothetical protein